VFKKPANIFDVRFLDGEFFTGPAQRVLSRIRRCTLAQLIVVTGGVYTATVSTERGAQRIRAQAGDVVFWPVGSEDTDESDSGRPLHCISIFLRWPHAPPDLPFVVRDANHVIDLLANRLIATAHDPAGKACLGPSLDAYLAAVFAEYVALARTAADDLLARVTQYIEEHIHRPIRLEELARQAGLEKHHFGRKYKQLTGRTPIQDVKRRKAAYAKHILLLTPSRTLSNIAGLVGVRDASKLSRLLTRHAGASARDIKRAARVSPRSRSSPANRGGTHRAAH
jgi:AraC-like DNA-binding protein